MIQYEWENANAYGRVALLASVTADGTHHDAFAYVSVWEIVESRDRDDRVRLTGATHMVALDEIKRALIWSEREAGTVSVLKPWGFR